MYTWFPMVLACLFFATMGVCVKFASAHYGSGEIVMVRGLVGVALLLVLARWRREPLRTTLPWQHARRTAVGVLSLLLWFHAIAGLPLATAMTLNYTSSLWLAVLMALGAAFAGTPSVDRRLAAVALMGFLGVVLVLRPTMTPQQWVFGLAGLLSGLLSAVAYLQVRGLAGAGEPETRIVFYFSLGSVVGGAALALASGWRPFHAEGMGWMLASGVLAAAGQMMLTRAYARGATMVNASLQYLGIAFSFGYGVLLFDDRVTGAALVGILLVVAAGVLATWLRARPATAAARA